MLSILLFYLLLLTQKENNGKDKEKNVHSGSDSMNIHRLFNLVYRLYSRTF